MPKLSFVTWPNIGRQCLVAGDWLKLHLVVSPYVQHNFKQIQVYTHMYRRKWGKSMQLWICISRVGSTSPFKPIIMLVMEYNQGMHKPLERVSLIVTERQRGQTWPIKNCYRRLRTRVWYILRLPYFDEFLILPCRVRNHLACISSNALDGYGPYLEALSAYACPTGRDTFHKLSIHYQSILFIWTDRHNASQSN